MEHPETLSALVLAAVWFGFFHTLIGPDHYLPFVALSKARGWSFSKTTLITFLCGCAHVLSSVVIGAVGLGIGMAVGALEDVEGTRADIVKWLLLCFGLFYTVWGVKKALQDKVHMHTDGTLHAHSHGFLKHEHKIPVRSSTNFWMLFIVFVFGPCEVLIPLLMAPAAAFDWTGVAMVTLAFSVATLTTMLVMVSALYHGLSLIKINMAGVQRWSHALAGLVLMLCAAVMFAGL